MKWLLSFVFSIFSLVSLYSQEIFNMNDFQHSNDSTNIIVKKLAGDSLVSSFYISIMDTVNTHKHLFHSEHVYILSGEGIIYLNDKQYNIKEKDFLFIPKNTWHAVKVVIAPMRAISIQAPEFDGTDRVLKTP